MPFGRRSPLEALALPGVILAYKYSQFRQRRREAADRRVTERELSALHNKIDKLLSKLEESEPELPTSQEDECVICINARATMQTSPCGHRVVCRRCFVKTIQSAVAQRLLPLRCVICRARVNRLITSSGTWRIQESASSYSMGNKTWSGVSGSPSSYSVDGGVAASASLYSMSSGSSYASGVSSNTSNSTNSSDKSSSTSSHHHLSALSLQTNNNDTLIQHQHPHGSCTIGCRGAIPRTKSINRRDSRYTRSRISELPPIKEFKSPTRSLSSIKTATSINPNTITTANPTVTNPKIRFASYTQKKSAPQEIKPLLLTENSVTVKKSVAKSRLNGAKVAPISTNTTNNNKMISNSARKYENNSSTIVNKNILARTATARNLNNLRNNNNNNNNNNTNNLTIINNTSFNANKNTIITINDVNKISTPHQIRNTTTTSNNNNNNNNNNDEKSDNKKNECIENKKKDDKLKLKAEKDAKKEEKRLAKEEERLAKHMAKEEKKKYKNKDDKELLLVNLKK